MDAPAHLIELLGHRFTDDRCGGCGRSRKFVESSPERCVWPPLKPDNGPIPYGGAI